MSIRIENIEQLKDPKLVEQVLDRLRRTTQPRYFIFKQRCKVLNDQPVLLTAAPGRKIKSSLIKSLRVGSPTLYGTVHRIKQDLFFTFKTDVDKTYVARWIAHCMHQAKSPVPLKNIIILGPSDLQKTLAVQQENTQEATAASAQKKRQSKSEQKSCQTNTIDSKPDIKEPSEDISLQELATTQYASTSDLLEDLHAFDQIFEKYLSEKIVQKWQSLIQKWHREVEALDEAEDLLSQLQEDLLQLSQQETTFNPSLLRKEKEQWFSFQQQILQANFSLDEYRTILARSPFELHQLQKELQFCNDEMQAFKMLRATWESNILELDQKLNILQDIPTQQQLLQQKYRKQEESIALLKPQIEESTSKLKERLEMICQKMAQKWLGSAMDPTQLFQNLTQCSSASISPTEIQALLNIWNTLQSSSNKSGH